MLSPRRHELLRRRRRDTMQELEQLDAGQLRHVLDEDEYRGMRFETLDEIEAEWNGDEFWREDSE